MMRANPAQCNAEVRAAITGLLTITKAEKETAKYIWQEIAVIRHLFGKGSVVQVLRTSL